MEGLMNKMVPMRKGYDFYNQKNTKKGSQSLRDIFIWGGIIFFVASLFILYLAQSIQYAELSYSLQINKQELERLRKENHLLDLERSRLASLERIEHIARNELHMQDPIRVEYLVLDTPSFSLDAEEVTHERRVDRLVVDFVFNWLENISRVEAGTLFQ